MIIKHIFIKITIAPTAYVTFLEFSASNGFPLPKNCPIRILAAVANDDVIR
jgi:hypothetical protein